MPEIERAINSAHATEQSSGSASLTSLEVTDPTVLVLATGESLAASSNARGHLFERFVARLLYLYGYNEPQRERLNVTSDGIEIDITAQHELSGHPAVVECKAYTSAVSAAQLGTFHSKLITARYASPDAQGFFVALPRLTSSGREQAELIEKHDARFKVLTTLNIVSLLRARGIVVDCPLASGPISDLAIIITEHGIHSACLELDVSSRLPLRVLAWDASTPLPAVVLDEIAGSDYAQGLPVFDARKPIPVAAAADLRPEVDADSLIVTVSGSSSDFEYQLPASPKYFVGRRNLVQKLSEALDAQAGVVVLNAQSGWGKSSAALRLQALVAERRGFALVVDSRTASSRRFVTEAIRVAAQRAAEERVLTLPVGASWATLQSALRTLKDAEWHGGPLVVFFDQFENVFRDEGLTREFRDLALSANEVSEHVVVGFAWKTDLVGWTESHPYQLRDEIRSSALVLPLGPLGVTEIDTLLRRLERALDQSLARDLRTRLREYSQGLPWLFKKLAGHLLREVASGATQEQLASEALNVQNLFDADLAELGPVEHEALRHVARHAPIAISEVLERVSGPVLETLVNRRLVVQVGERLDTYWDIFRDYLNTGRIPIEDSYILRQSPNSVARLLQQVAVDAGDSRVSDIAARLGTSENGVFNLSRELRLLGATAYEPNRVRVIPEIWSADDPEGELRRRVAGALRRHRAYSTFVRMADRTSGVGAPAYAQELATLFPAVEVSNYTWQTYARVYLQWFEYAGLAIAKGPQWHVAPEGSPGTGRLLGGQVRRRLRGGWPQRQARPCVEELMRVASGDIASLKEAPREIRDLVILGAVALTEDNVPYLPDVTLVEGGVLNPAKLRALMARVPGVSNGLLLLESDGSAHPRLVGQAVKDAISADWADGTTLAVGKQLRSWARYAGFDLPRASRMP